MRRHRAKRDRVVPDAGKVLGNLPGLRSQDAEHESLEFLFAKVLDHLQPSGHCLVGLDQAGAPSGLTSRGARNHNGDAILAWFFPNILGF